MKNLLRGQILVSFMDLITLPFRLEMHNKPQVSTVRDLALNISHIKVLKPVIENFVHML